MALSPFQRAFGRRPPLVTFKTSEAGYEQRIRRNVAGQEVHIADNDAGYLEAIKGRPTAADRLKALSTGDLALANKIAEQMNAPIETSKFRYRVDYGAADRGGGFSGTPKVFRTPLTEETYLAPKSPEVTKTYTPIRQRAGVLPISRKRGGLSSVLGGSGPLGGIQ